MARERRAIVKSDPRALGPADRWLPRMPAVIVTVGGGGVGKTTTSAALALALADSGLRTLVVTIDPARRLAGVLGVAVGAEVTDVARGDGAARLAALMPDARGSMRAFIDDLFIHEAEAKSHLLNNRLFQALSDSVAGVHELVAMSLVASAAESDRFDVIVIDTAPSRNALDFVTYPGRLAALLGGKTTAWFAGIAERAARPGEQPRGGLLAWGASRVEALLARVTGPHLLSDTASLFGDLAHVRTRFVERTRHASDLLLGPKTAYVVVTAPTPAAIEDAIFLDERLRKLHREPVAFVMNRADPEDATQSPAALLRTLRDAATSEDLRVVLDALEGEREGRARLADQHAHVLSRGLRGRPLLRLPLFESTSPAEVARRIAGQLLQSGLLRELVLKP